MNTNTQATEFDVNSLLDGTLDDLADAPEFKPYPAGTHIVLATLVDKTAKKDMVNKHPAFELRFKAISTEELSNPETDKPLEAGAECNVLYMLDNDMGQGNFKKLLKTVAEKFGPATPRELAAQVKDLQCLVVTKKRSNKEKTQEYMDIVELVIV